jgi:AmpD protein
MQVKNGWLSDATICPSPNFNERPDGQIIDVLVIHNISLPPGQFGGQYVQDFFQNKLDCTQHSFFEEIAALKVSAHCFIDRSGMLTQFVDLNMRAWHAGASHFRGRDECNDFSIGIEMEGCDDLAYTELQYQRLLEVTEALMQAYPAIVRDNIVGHSDIAPDRKTDPGPAFDWSRYLDNLPD